MSHDLPVIALAAAAAPETMGPAGVLVERFDPASVAELIGLVTEDQTLRDTIIATQKERLKTFSRKTAIASFRAMLQTAFSRVPA
jgi:glycosyltransferase involved in cell wall biosynthesis